MNFEQRIRSAAFDHLAQLEVIYGDGIPARELQKGFILEGENVQFRSSASGIFKPRQLNDVVLSIATTISKTGSRNIYKDYEDDDGAYYYAFEESKTGEYRNQYLINTFESEAPFIYFKAVAPAVYQCIWPCYIESIDETNRTVKIIVGPRTGIFGSVTEMLHTKPKEIQARYYVREAKTRGHQAKFREEVLKAYANKCAITGLPETKLLQAAHIIPDAEYSGIQTVCNGLALNYLHHRAYDSFLVGIDAEYRIHIAHGLLSLKDGPLLKYGIHSFQGKEISLPRNREARPNQDLLNRTFEKFVQINSI